MRILVFAPHAATWIHAFPEAVVAEALAKAGHEIVYVTCDRMFADYCVAMSASGVDFAADAEKKRGVCERCNAHAGLIRQRFGFGGADLGTWRRSEDEAVVERVFAQAQRDAPGAASLDGIPLGRFALYQLLIRRKKMSQRFSDEEWEEFRVQLASVTRAALALQRLFAEQRFDRVLLYNGLYSVNLVCRFLADRAGAPAYFLHAGLNLAHRLQTLMVGRDQTFRYYPALLRHWSRFRDRPASPELIRGATDHFVELLSGRSGFVYSVPKSGDASLRHRFGVPQGARLLVATLSSYDEAYAAEAIGARVIERPPVFATQAEWVQALVRFVAGRADLFLLVRVHPREFPNRRERVQSQHAELLREILAELPANVRVNWPDDGISLYDLAEEADAFLNSWSSAGKEMSLLGCPVVTYTPEQIFYPAELNYAAQSVDEYFALVDRALADGWDPRRITRAFRWLAVEFGYGVIDIGDAYAERETARRSTIARGVRFVRRAIDPLFAQKDDCARRPTSPRAAPVLARLVESGADTVLDVLRDDELGETGAEEEAAAVRAQIGRLLPHLYPGRATPIPGTLHARLAEFAA